jgi:hypothetical protein
LQAAAEDHAIKVLPHNKEKEVQVAVVMEVLVQVKLVQQILVVAADHNIMLMYLQVNLVLVVQV